MAWIYLHKGKPALYDDAVTELTEEASHRAVAITAGAFVEDHLKTLIQAHMVEDALLVPAMFTGTGALSNFGTNINLGYLMGLYSQRAWKELTTISKIRNAFAHRLEVKDFDEGPAKDWCEALKIWEEAKIKIANIGGKGLPVTLSLTIGPDSGIEVTETEVLLIDPLIRTAPFRPRERYLNSCKFFLAAITVAVQMAPDKPSPLF